MTDSFLDLVARGESLARFGFTPAEQDELLRSCLELLVPDRAASVAAELEVDAPASISYAELMQFSPFSPFSPSWSAALAPAWGEADADGLVGGHGEPRWDEGDLPFGDFGRGDQEERPGGDRDHDAGHHGLSDGLEAFGSGRGDHDEPVAAFEPAESSSTGPAAHAFDHPGRSTDPTQPEWGDQHPARQDHAPEVGDTGDGRLTEEDDESGWFDADLPPAWGNHPDEDPGAA